MNFFKKSNKKIVKNFVKLLINKDEKALKYVSEDFKQKNSKKNIDSLKTLLSNDDKKMHYEIKRSISEGDFVFLHSELEFENKKFVSGDLFKLENGQIIWHMDSIIGKMPNNPSNRSQLDGEEVISDKQKTEINKNVVKEFMESVLMRGEGNKMANYFDGNNYIQHNPQIGDGLSGLGNAMAEMSKSGITMSYEKIVLSIAEGNFVVTISEGKLGPNPMSYIDIFRIENEKIAEHWDIMNPVVSMNAKNNMIPKGKFN